MLPTEKPRPTKRYDQFLELQAQQTDDCVLWPYGRYGNGYGKVCHGGTVYPTHRLACILAYGPPPFPDAQAAHSCHTPLCMNPRHLRWATRKENAADRIKDGTKAVGETHGSAKLTEQDVLEIRSLARSGISQSSIGEWYGVGQQNISMIVTRKNWSFL